MLRSHNLTDRHGRLAQHLATITDLHLDGCPGLCVGTDLDQIGLVKGGIPCIDARSLRNHIGRKDRFALRDSHTRAGLESTTRYIVCLSDHDDDDTAHMVFARIRQRRQRHGCETLYATPDSHKGIGRRMMFVHQRYLQFPTSQQQITHRHTRLAQKVVGVQCARVFIPRLHQHDLIVVRQHKVVCFVPYRFEVVLLYRCGPRLVPTHRHTTIHIGNVILLQLALLNHKPTTTLHRDPRHANGWLVHCPKVE